MCNLFFLCRSDYKVRASNIALLSPSDSSLPSSSLTLISNMRAYGRYSDLSLIVEDVTYSFWLSELLCVLKDFVSGRCKSLSYLWKWCSDPRDSSIKSSRPFDLSASNVLILSVVCSSSSLHSRQIPIFDKARLLLFFYSALCAEIITPGLTPIQACYTCHHNGAFWSENDACHSVRIFEESWEPETESFGIYFSFVLYEPLISCEMLSITLLSWY